MRKLLLTTAAFGLALAARPAPARADFALGLFLGDPTGLDVKVGLNSRSGLDLLFGVNTLSDNRVTYGHVTYLITPLVTQGESIQVPLRFGIGAAVYGDDNNINIAARVPVELALRFHNPLEIYGELAVLFTIDEGDIDLQGGGGIRLYF